MHEYNTKKNRIFQHEIGGKLSGYVKMTIKIKKIPKKVKKINKKSVDKCVTML